jgi:non-heme chloroperoxidase
VPFYGHQQAGRRGFPRREGRLLAAGDAGGGLKNEYECIKAFSETDLTEDLKRFDVLRR